MAKNYFFVFLSFLLASQTKAQGSFIADMNTLPTVIEKNESFKLFMRVKNTHPDSIKIVKPGAPAASIHLNGSTFSSVTLFDNGLNGDLVANDSIFTRGNFNYNPLGCASTNSTMNQIMFRYADVFFYTSGTSITENIDLQISIACYDSTKIPKPNVIKVNDTLQYTSKTINIKRTSYWGQNPFPAYSYWINNPLFSTLFCGDIYFLIQNTTSPMFGGPGGRAAFGPSSNFTQGIGYGQYDLGLPFVGIVSVYWTFSIEPSTVHEFLHKWAAYQDLYGGLASSHWGYVKMPSSGLLGPTSFEFDSINQIGVDTFYVERNYFKTQDSHWSKLELYLAGLIPLDSVDFPLTYIENATTINLSATTVKGKLSQITKQQWIDTVGSRVPSSDPNVYNVIQVVFSNELLSAGQLSYFDEGLTRAERKTMNPVDNCDELTLYGATGGKLEMKSAVECTAVNEIADSELRFNIYPNPSSEFLTLTFISPVKNGTLNVYNLLGEKIFQTSVIQKELKLDFSKQPSGIYFIEAIVNGKRVVKKMVKG